MNKRIHFFGKYYTHRSACGYLLDKSSSTLRITTLNEIVTCKKCIKTKFFNEIRVSAL